MHKSSAAFSLAALLVLSAPTFAQQVAVLAGHDGAVFQARSSFHQVHLTVVGPAGLVLGQSRSAGSDTTFRLDVRGLVDGQYQYRFDYALNGASAAADPALPINADGRAVGTIAGPLPPAAQSGGFQIIKGVAYFPKLDTHESDQDVADKTVSTAAPKDVVVPDDQIVQGSLCIGLDCVNNESFGFDTIRLKENNLRIKFEDTSASGFPTRDWQLLVNDSEGASADVFAIEDVTAGTRPLSILGNAPTNAIFVDATGRVGLRTGAPVLDLQISTANTPGQRLEQTSAGGYSAQTWDVAGNEANFFVRDVTNGSLLPLRIRPGAPTSSIDINSVGNVGIGTASPASKLQVQQNVLIDAPVALLTVVNSDASIGAATNRFQVDSNGNVFARGSISQLSSRTAKEKFEPIDGAALLAKVDALPVTTWHYIAAPDRHLGPVAEDFHAAFGLGDTDKAIAPADLAGVALAAVKALQDQVQQRDKQIELLERRLSELEARTR